MKENVNKITNVGLGIYFLYIFTMVIINFSGFNFSFKLHSMLGLAMINDILLDSRMIFLQFFSIIIFTVLLWKDSINEKLLMYKYTIGATSLVAIIVTFISLEIGITKGIKIESLSKDVYTQLIEYSKENNLINGTIEISLPSKDNKLTVTYSSMFNKMYINGAEQEIKNIELSIIEREILEQTKIEKDVQASFLY